MFRSYCLFAAMKETPIIFPADLSCCCLLHLSLNWGFFAHCSDMTIDLLGDKCDWHGWHHVALRVLDLLRLAGEDGIIGLGSVRCQQSNAGDFMPLSALATGWSRGSCASIAGVCYLMNVVVVDWLGRFGLLNFESIIAKDVGEVGPIWLVDIPVNSAQGAIKFFGSDCFLTWSMCWLWTFGSCSIFCGQICDATNICWITEK